MDFAKQVPGFLQLGREDQIALLKASTIEVMGGLALPSCPRGSPGLSLRTAVGSMVMSHVPPVVALVGRIPYRGM